MGQARLGGRWRDGAALLCALTLLTLGGCGGNGSNSAALSISGAPVVQVAVGKSYFFAPTVHDTSGKAISFSIQNKPSWASFSIATGQLSGSPTNADVGSYSGVVISVSDGTTTSSLPPFTVTVNQSATGSVTLSWTAPTTNSDGSALTNLGGYTIEYGTSSTSLNQSVTVGSASTTTYTIDNLEAGTWYFSVVANTTDGLMSPPSNVVSTTVN